MDDAITRKDDGSTHVVLSIEDPHGGSTEDLQDHSDPLLDRADPRAEAEIELSSIGRRSRHGSASDSPGMEETPLDARQAHPADFVNEPGSWMLADEPITTLTPFDANCILPFFAVHSYSIFLLATGSLLTTTWPTCRSLSLSSRSSGQQARI